MRNNQSNTIIYRRYIAQLANTYRNRSDIRMFVELILTSLAILLFSVFAIRPTLITIGGLTTEIREKKATIATMDTKIANIITAQDVYNRETARLAILRSAIPAEPSVAQALTQMESVAKAHAVTFFSVNTSQIPVSVSDETEQKVSFTITITGDYSGLQATLKDLENVRRPISVSSSSLSLDQSGADALIYLTITGEIPYYPVITQPTP